MGDAGKLYFGRLSGKQLFLVLLPVLLIVSTYFAFQFFVGAFGLKPGYLAGFLFYWIFWCFIIPLILVGPGGIAGLFKKPEKTGLGWLNIVLLIIPCALAIFGGPFFGRLPKTDLVIVLLSLAIAVVNAFGEEVLWRGVFCQYFKRPPMGLLFPLIGFALWHVSPNSVNPSSFGIPMFVLFSGILGVFWGIVAYRTKSLRWTLVSHIIVDFSGFGALFYLS